MSKKAILGILVFAVMAGGVFQQAQAQEKKVRFGLNAGALWFGDIEDEFLYTLGAAVDFRLGANFLISPEIDMWTYKFHFEGFVLSPGLIVNYQPKSFFIGAGLIYPVLISEFEDAEFWSVLPKFNIGLRGKHLRLTAYAITDFQFSGVIFGGSVGYIF